MSVTSAAALITVTPAASVGAIARLRRLPVLPVALLALSVGIAVQVIAGVGLFHLDVLVSRDHWRSDLGPASLLQPVAYQAQRLGQRGVILAIAVPLVSWLAVRLRSWRPVVVLGGAALLFNVVVGALKVLTARPRPIDGIAHTFVGGTEFPSGHAAGSVVLWGTVAYLVYRHLPQAAGRRVSGWVLTLAVATITLEVSLSSLYLDMHWLTDVLAAWTIGGLLLWVVIRVDQHGERQLTTPPIMAPIP